MTAPFFQTSDGHRIVLVTIDRETSVVTFHRSDGKEAHFPFEFPFDRTSSISRLQWAPHVYGLLLTTTRGDQFAAELPTRRDETPLRGRPIVYLDQRDWSTLAKAENPDASMSESAREAALRLTSLAQQRRIVMPLASAHMSETGKWSDHEARYRHALQLSRLSSGWQMRDPLTLRRQEIANALAQRYNPGSARQLAAFTLAPNVLHDEVRGGGSLASNLPPDYAYAAEALTSQVVNFDVLLDEDSIPMKQSPSWVRKYQEFAEWLATEKTERELKRARTDLFFLSDITGELSQAAVQAGVTPDELRDWLTTHANHDIRAMPCLGLAREAAFDKLVNARATWESNDLMDTMYLTCAAGYAQHVLCEKHWAGFIGQGTRRLGRSTQVWSKLPLLVEALESEVADYEVAAGDSPMSSDA